MLHKPTGTQTWAVSASHSQNLSKDYVELEGRGSAGRLSVLVTDHFRLIQFTASLLTFSACSTPTTIAISFIIIMNHHGHHLGHMVTTTTIIIITCVHETLSLHIHLNSHHVQYTLHYCFLLDSQNKVCSSIKKLNFTKYIKLLT